MRVVVAICIVLALSAVSGKRIHHVKSELQANSKVLDPRTDLEAGSAGLTSGKAMNYDEMRKQFFNDNVVRIAADQGKPAVRQIGAYENVGVARTCTNGNCGEWGPDYKYDDGTTGIVTATLIPAASGKPEQIDIEFRYYWSSCQYGTKYCMSHLKCLNVGRSADGTNKCEFSQYMNAKRPNQYGNPDLYTSAPSISQSDAAQKVKANTLKITTKGLLVQREYYEGQYSASALRHTVRNIRGTYGADAFVKATYMADSNYVADLSKDTATALTAAKKKQLTTAEIIAKFFTADNIDLARMQGANVPVKAVVGAYSTALFTKTCDAGVCDAWTTQTLVSPKTFGGEGTINLQCTVPQDMTKAECGVTMTMKGGYGYEYQSFAICPKVGGGVTKCNGAQSCPRYYSLETDRSTDRTFWNPTDFVKSVTEADEFYFTADQVIARWKWHGNTRGDAYSQPKLLYTELVALSTPISDFGAAAKTNCLSKTTAAAVLKAAAEKKGLKNKIVLQSGAVADLIKGAPYKSIDEAVLKVKGIGPVNVVYVSFMWNFMC